jgi:hypothetical protein
MQLAAETCGSHGPVGNQWVVCALGLGKYMYSEIMSNRRKKNGEKVHNYERTG